MYTREEENLIIASSFDELTYRAKCCLAGVGDFVKNRSNLIKDGESGVYNKVKDKFSDFEYRKTVLDGLERRNVTCVTVLSENYPQLLKRLPNSPLTLFCKGNTALLNTRCFAIVGSRRTLPSILGECRKISGEVSSRFTVVTGLADGADSAAIEGALPSGKVISVLANGFDHVYPAVNTGLFERVAQQGLVISEYPPKTAPKSYYFPVRNRIIAGLCEGTLVVSAGERSGALITAECAVEYDRNVFALPYTVGVASGEGCNKLIRNGAFLTRNTLDIFSVFGLDFKPKAAPPLTEFERKLYELIKDEGEAFVPDVAEKLGVAPYKLIAPLSSLEIKGLVVRLGGNRYAPL